MKGKRVGFFVLLLALIVFGLSGSGFASGKEIGRKKHCRECLPAIEKARMEIWKEITNKNAASATLAMMDGQRIVHLETFGMRDREKSLAPDFRTQYNIGSVSKVIVTAAILTLCDCGKVDLDKPVAEYLPEFIMEDARYRDITVRMLLNHTSGMPGTNSRNLFGAKRNHSYLEETIAYLAENGVKHDPGWASVYCNDGFSLAEAIVERVAGMSFADYVRLRLFWPLKMRESSCFFKKGNSNIAHVYGADGKRLPVEYVSGFGAGGVSSTAADLCRFATILQSRKILSVAAIEQFTKAQQPPATSAGERPLYNFGLGWDAVTVGEFAEGGLEVLGKSGGTLHYSAHLLTAPKEKLSVAVIFAGCGISAGAVANSIMLEWMRCKGILPWDDEVYPPPRDKDIPSDILDYAGYYASAGDIMKISFDSPTNSMLIAKWDGKRFLLSETCRYQNDGYFHSSGGGRFYLTTYEGCTYLLSVAGKSIDFYSIIAGGLSCFGISKWDGGRFAGKKWLFRNATTYDFAPEIAETGLIPELPGSVYYKGSVTILCALDGEEFASMVLKTARDILEMRLIELDSETFLDTGNFIFSDASKTVALGSSGIVAIGLNSFNEWRRVEEPGVLHYTMPAGGRVMIFSSNNEKSFDSLYDNSSSVAVSEGEYVCFIGRSKQNFLFELRN